MECNGALRRRDAIEGMEWNGMEWCANEVGEAAAVVSRGGVPYQEVTYLVRHRRVRGVSRRTTHRSSLQTRSARRFASACRAALRRATRSHSRAYRATQSRVMCDVYVAMPSWDGIVEQRGRLRVRRATQWNGTAELETVVFDVLTGEACEDAA